jgi:hypothetical protein
MSRIINIDTDRLLVERDDNNITYYNKSGLSVSIEDSRLILRVNGGVAERLNVVDISAPAGDPKSKLLQVQTWIEEYIPPAPDLSIRLRSNTVADPDTDIQLKLGTNLSVTGDTLNASGSGGASWGSITGTLSSQADLQSALDGKVPTTRTVNAKALSNNITLDKTDIGLSNVPNTDATNPANISQNASYRFVTDAEKTTWNGKQDAIGFTPENVSNKETSALDTSTTKYPCNNVVKSAVDSKQATLVSGTNIKTVNGNSLLGSGDVAITTGQSFCKYNQFAQNLAVSNVAATIGTKTLTVAQGDTFEVLVSGRIFNNSGATRSYNIVLNIGGTIMTTTASTTIAAGATAAIYYRGVIHVYDDTVIYMNALYTPLAASADNASATATMRHSWRQVGVNRTGSQAVSAAIIASNTGTQTFNGSIVINQIPSIS